MKKFGYYHDGAGKRYQIYLQLWTNEEKQWADQLYNSPGFRSVSEWYIEISKLLDGKRPGPERSRLVREMRELERG